MKLHTATFALVLLPALAAAESEVKFARDIPYQDISIIQPNVIEACKSLGVHLSDFIAQGIAAHGFVAERVDNLDLAKDSGLDIRITNLLSAGNAFIGHRKSLTVSVKVFKDGEANSTKVFSRDTMGGLAGGFKSSCDVLDRAAETIGKDIGRWYKDRG